jgi:hypothetical protein
LLIHFALAADRLQQLEVSHFRATRSVRKSLKLHKARLDKMDAKMERWAVRMVIAMLISQTTLGPIGMSALDAVRRVLSTLVH